MHASSVVRRCCLQQLQSEPEQVHAGLVKFGSPGS